MLKKSLWYQTKLSMWWRRSLSLLGLLVLAGCGFTPALSEKQNPALVSAYQATNVTIPDRDRTAQVVKTEIENRLYKTGRTAPRYKLDLNVSSNRTNSAVQRDRLIRRYDVIVTANYTLTDTQTNAVLGNGALTRRGSFDGDESDYAIYAAEQYTREVAAKELAKDLFTQLSAFLPRS